MRMLLLIVALLYFGGSATAQNSICGEYHDYAGSRLILRIDSTFRLLRQYDGWSTWCDGRWTFRRDTATLTPVPVLDTMLVHGYRGYIDSLFLSEDAIPQRFYGKHFPFVICHQDTEYIPDCFFHNKDRLRLVAPTGILWPAKEGTWTRIEPNNKSEVTRRNTTSFQSGIYVNEFGSEYRIKDDSTFEYNWSGHMSHRWATGTWSINQDTIYFHPKVIADTATLTDVRDLSYDTIFFSYDDSTQRFTDTASYYGGASWQSPEMVADKLWIHKKRLYYILPDGEVDRKKRDDGWPGRRDLRYSRFVGLTPRGLTL